MNITPSTIYWISVLDSMLGVAVLIAILSWIAGVIMLVAYFVSHDEEEIACSLRRLLAATACAFVASTVTCIFTPSAKTCAAMYVVPAIANSEKLQGVTDGIYDLAIEWLKELKPAKSKGEKGGAK